MNIIREVQNILSAGLFHSTSPAGFRGILRTGAILPNRGQFPFTYPQSERSWGRERGWISLFDFPAATPQQQLETMDRWFNCAVPFSRTLMLEIDRDSLTGYMSNKVASQGGLTAVLIPYVEAWHGGPIPVSSIKRVVSVSQDVSGWQIQEFRLPLKSLGAVDRWLRQNRYP